jgi:hypothetical protein
VDHCQSQWTGPGDYLSRVYHGTIDLCTRGRHQCWSPQGTVTISGGVAGWQGRVLMSIGPARDGCFAAFLWGILCSALCGLEPVRWIGQVMEEDGMGVRGGGTHGIAARVFAFGCKVGHRYGRVVDPQGWLEGQAADFSPNYSDVRDVARAHVLAAEIPSASGRYIVSQRWNTTPNATSALLRVCGVW